MKVSTIVNKYRNNINGLELPDDGKFIRECARKYIISQIKIRLGVEKHRKTAKGKTSNCLAQRRFQLKKKQQLEAEKQAKIEAKKILDNKTI